MWKLLILFVFLSVDAQRFKLNQSAREGVEILDVKAYQDATVGYRLPNDTRPESYTLNLNFGDFHDGDMSFTGNVAILIHVVEPTDRITLHSSVQNVVTSLRTASNAEISHTVSFEPDQEFLIIKTEEVLAKNTNVQLTVSYQGTIVTSINGIYRGSYQHDSERRFK